MFSLFKPRCPLDEETEAWVNDRMQWLVDQFGREQLLSNVVVVPTREFFPEEYEPKEECLRRLFARMCGYMQVDPTRVDLQFFEGASPVAADKTGLNTMTSGEPSIYDDSAERPIIWLNVDSLDDPPAVVATMAHELGHVHLLGDQRLAPEEEDHEAVTDLLTVFLGLGVLTANAAVRDRHVHRGPYSSWSISQQGYLTMPVFGYALAWQATQRKERRPAWAKHLRLDVASPLKASLKYLEMRG